MMIDSDIDIRVRALELALDALYDAPENVVPIAEAFYAFLTGNAVDAKAAAPRADA